MRIQNPHIRLRVPRWNIRDDVRPEPVLVKIQLQKIVKVTHSKGENDRSGRLNRSDTGRVQPRALNFHTVPVAYSTTGYSFEAHGVSGRTAWTR
jgi:hypothetical protein